jgi:hypothetical protein
MRSGLVWAVEKDEQSLLPHPEYSSVILVELELS